MIKRIFRSTLLSSLGVFLAGLLLTVGIVYRYFTDVQLEQLETQTALAAQGISFEGREYFDGLKTSNVRITWVDNVGSVLYDTKSDPAKMENHGSREEIKEALANGYGESVRYSSTLTQTSIYTAQRLDNGTIVRLSVTQHSILLLLFGLLPQIVLITLLATLLSVWVARYTARRIVWPLNNLDLDNPLDNAAYEELSPLLRRIDHHQKEIVAQSQLLTQKKGEFDTIISKIREGMVLLDNERQIISINAAAQQLFQTDASSIGKDILEVVRDLDFHQLVEMGLSGQKCEGMLTIEAATYRVLIRPTFADDAVTGLVVLLFDVTEQWQADQLRREFTANVSHELKTPLHIISGYSEMLKNQLVPAEDVETFAEKIYNESQRMVQLIEDVIHISHLDESPEMQIEEVELYQLTRACLDRLSSKASQKEVKLHLKGEPVSIKGNPALLSSAIYNLCDNAITYNHENGDVFVTLASQGQEATLTIQDTGIGIPKGEEERIFERFYRVDKSRSKKVGGTGLGLSIVKHALKCHNASIHVDSQLGQGTTMTVTFKQ
ncbi:sensor histidine kinase [Streptococcus ovis]|uniref:sensor histidine kinase n=1 Tax=Streptococcus ovis TaxID=82806 RepID=UPI0003713238|nr:ATP-binding protein [Streptococcus ovis]